MHKIPVELLIKRKSKRKSKRISRPTAFKA